MKKFICVIPRQKAGDLSNVRYQAQGNRALDYPGTTRFPVIPLIWGYGQEGEEIRVIALSADYDNCRCNLELLKEEFDIGDGIDVKLHKHIPVAAPPAAR